MYTRSNEDPTDQLRLLMEQYDELRDALTESPDEFDVDFGNPTEWPAWTDEFNWNITRPEEIVQLRKLGSTPWQNWLATPAEEKP